MASYPITSQVTWDNQSQITLVDSPGKWQTYNCLFSSTGGWLLEMAWNEKKKNRKKNHIFQ